MKRIIATLLLVAFGVEAIGQDKDLGEAKPAWKAGLASAVITPKTPLPMAGYAARKDPAEGTEQDLFGKALAIEDEAGNRLVFVTLDLIGVTRLLRAEVAKQVHERYQLSPESLVMNASHTHCGPAYQREESKEYFAFLKETLIELVGNALDRLEPANLTYCHARCGFAMNRRTPSPKGYRNHPNPEGPVDHSVPVLRITDANGDLKGVLFGYACHNTTMGFLRWLGDYAGYAQEYFEQDQPGVTALFFMGCGGDQNPYPRSKLHLAKEHGRTLATAIHAALQTNQRPINGPIRTALETVELEFAVPDKPPAACPVQIVQFGNDLCIVALSSEVVVDYSLRLKAELNGPDRPIVWVAGYSNEYDGYIPSKRVLLEGGYEAESRPWKHTLEERIVGKVHELYKRVNEQK